jgi:ankyrin repeat protein
MGHSKIVNQLLVWGCAVDTIDSEGRIVLSIAAAQGNVDVVQQLLDRGLDEMRPNTLIFMTVYWYVDICINFHIHIYRRSLKLITIINLFS